MLHRPRDPAARRGRDEFGARPRDACARPERPRREPRVDSRVPPGVRAARARAHDRARPRDARLRRGQRRGPRGDAPSDRRRLRGRGDHRHPAAAAVDRPDLAAALPGADLPRALSRRDVPRVRVPDRLLRLRDRGLRDPRPPGVDDAHEARVAPLVARRQVARPRRRQRRDPHRLHACDGCVPRADARSSRDRRLRPRRGPRRGARRARRRRSRLQVPAARGDRARGHRGHPFRPQRARRHRGRPPHRARGEEVARPRRGRGVPQGAALGLAGSGAGLRVQGP